MVGRVLAAAAVLLAAGCAGGSDERLTLPPGELFAVSTTITPKTGGFGDTLTAGIRILMDRDRVDPESVKVLYRFRPYRDRTRVERVDAGNLTALLYTIELQCLTLYCVPPEGGLVNSWGARITSGVGPVQDVLFPESTIVSRTGEDRFTPENTGESPEQWPPRWRAAVALPEPSYRLAPATLAWILGLVGGGLLAGAALAGWTLARRGRLLRAPVVSPLERALELLRRARTPEERRRALEALALALEDERELAEPARELAWSERQPSQAAVDELASLAEAPR